tara:strand:+ start:519 stop:707 length:189 start_codon:yes stop_codon:yes gene_type:complete
MSILRVILGDQLTDSISSLSNREKLSSNFRMTMMYKTYDRMDESKKTKIREDTEIFLKRFDY